MKRRSRSLLRSVGAVPSELVHSAVAREHTLRASGAVGSLGVVRRCKQAGGICQDRNGKSIFRREMTLPKSAHSYMIMSWTCIKLVRLRTRWTIGSSSIAIPVTAPRYPKGDDDSGTMGSLQGTGRSIVEGLARSIGARLPSVRIRRNRRCNPGSCPRLRHPFGSYFRGNWCKSGPQAKENV